MIYVCDPQPSISYGHYLKLFWAEGIKCCVMEGPERANMEDYYAKRLGANHIIVWQNDGFIRFKSRRNDAYLVLNIPLQEVIEYLKRILGHPNLH